MSRSTGDQTFDAMLAGGVPAGRTVLVRGESGAGTRRLAARFLDGSGDALLVTPDPAVDAPRAAAATVVSLSDAGEDEVALTSLAEADDLPASADGGSVALDAPADFPETASAGELAAVLEDAWGAFDRVVVTGAEDVAEFAGGVREVTALCAGFEGTGASCLVTVSGEMPALSRHAAGVVECWLESVDGDYQPFVRVRAFDGNGHDARRHRLSLSANGPTVVSRESDVRVPRLSSGIEGFDELTGGFIRGGTTVFEHDGVADHWPFTAATCANVVEKGAAVVLITAPGVVSRRVADLLEPRVGTPHELMAEDDLYVVDPVSNSGEPAAMTGFPDENLILQSETGSLQESIRSLVQELSGRPALAVLEVTPVLHLVDDDQARQLFYWATSNVLAMEGMSLVLSVDRAVASEELSAFLASMAQQVVRTWQGEGGLQYCSVRKSPDGSPGHSRTVEPIAEVPFVRLR